MKILRIGTVSTLVMAAIAFRIGDVQAESDKPRFATGVVYHDGNGNQTYDAGERLLLRIRVSNGREIVRTNGEGRYRLPIGEDSIVFVIKPRGWRTPMGEDQLPQFYYIHKPKGSPHLRYVGVEPTGRLPDSIDFALYPQNEPDTFRAILFADPQPNNQKENDYVAHDVVEELVGTDASFGVTLGDIMNSDLSPYKYGESRITSEILPVPNSDSCFE